MQGRRNIKIFIVPLLICLVFLFGIVGYRQLMGDGFSLPGAIYSTLFFFILNNVDPAEATSNTYLLISRYLAAVVFGMGIYSLVYGHIKRQFIRLKIRYTFRDHVIVFSIEKLSANIFSDLLTNKYKVILAEGNDEHPSLERIKNEGIIHFSENAHTVSLFDTMQVVNARACVIAFEDDNTNIDLSLKLIDYLREKNAGRQVRVLTHIGDSANIELIKDHVGISGSGRNFEFEIFNIPGAAAKKIYDTYPPHAYFNFEDHNEEHAIAVIGYDQAAEEFIVENMILSHYHDGRHVKIYLVDKNADEILHDFVYKYPYYREYVDIIPVKLLNNKFFANFNWSKEVIEKLSRVKCAYCFGDDGASLINNASRFRQFLAGQVEQYMNAPIIICLPENSSIVNLLDEERNGEKKLGDIFEQQLNVSLVHMVSDSCTSSRLLEEREYIDTLSRVINYYYSIKYEFAGIVKHKWQADINEVAEAIAELLKRLAEQHNGLGEQEIEHIVLDKIELATKLSKSQLATELSIRRCWERLAYQKKSANYYAARHLAVKMAIMKHLGCVPLTYESILQAYPVIAPVEHTRWCAERMVMNYRYGALPKEGKARSLVKDRLKIHDQLVPYNRLNEHEKKKDLDIFLLMPLLNSLKVDKNYRNAV